MKSQRQLSIVALLVQMVSVLLPFLTGMYYWEHWEPEGVGIFALKVRISFNYFKSIGNTHPLLGYIVFAIIAANVILSLLSIFTKVKIGKYIPIGVSIISLVSYVALSLLMGVRDEYGYQVALNTLFYVEVFVLCVNMVILFLQSNNKKESEQTEHQ